MQELGEDNPLTKWDKNKPRESHIRQSKTRKEKYASGELVPDKNCGAGVKSTLKCKYGTFDFRSRDELIYAIYLVLNDIEFSYEDKRVTYEDKTYFCDFCVNGEIIEIKQRPSSKLLKEKEAFEKNGYKFKPVYHKDIVELEKEISDKINLEKLDSELKEFHKNKSAFI